MQADAHGHLEGIRETKMHGMCFFPGACLDCEVGTRMHVQGVSQYEVLEELEDVFRFGALSENERPDLGTILFRTSLHGQLVRGFFSHSMSQVVTNHILLQCLVKLLYTGDICMQHVPFRIRYCTFKTS